MRRPAEITKLAAFEVKPVRKVRRIIAPTPSDYQVLITSRVSADGLESEHIYNTVLESRIRSFGVFDAGFTLISGDSEVSKIPLVFESDLPSQCRFSVSAFVGRIFNMPLSNPPGEAFWNYIALHITARSASSCHPRVI